MKRYLSLTFFMFLLIGCSPHSETPLSDIVSPIDNADLVYIPAGEFLMGTSPEQLSPLIEECIEILGNDFVEACESKYNNQTPQHVVYLDAYWIDKYEVSNAMFVAFLNDVGWRPYQSEPWYIIADKGPPLDIHFTGDSWIVDEGFEDYPIWQVPWYGADAYCNWAGRRLPTEAEWEKAARGDDGRQYPWGDSEPTCELAMHGSLTYEYCGDAIHVEVDQLPDGASPYGVFNMLGNVEEWVADWYDSDYYQYSPNENPIGPEEGDLRVIRGINVERFPLSLRIPFRDASSLDVRDNYGFRCATSSIE